jgi:hypothetical protein
MKYALMIYSKPGSLESLSEAEYAEVNAEFLAIRDDPACLDGAQLHPTEMSTTVRVDGGETLVTDGPFADVKEVVAGYYVVDVDDIDAATAIAARIPSARLGGAIEIRPLVEKPMGQPGVANAAATNSAGGA